MPQPLNSKFFHFAIIPDDTHSKHTAIERDYHATFNPAEALA